MAVEDIKNKPKKRNDAYTGFLAISFLAMVGGCVLLYLEYDQYQGKKLPEQLKLDVPGTQLKIAPGTGGPPPERKKEEEAPPKEDMPMPMPMPMPMMMKLEQKQDAVPVSIPSVEKVEVAKPSAPLPDPIILPEVPATLHQIEAPFRTEKNPIIAIPDLASPTRPIEPATFNDDAKLSNPPKRIQPQTSPVKEPSIDDEPPIPQKRFQPPQVINQ